MAGAPGDGPPAALPLTAAPRVLAALPGPREGRAWLVEWRRQRGLLRQSPAPTDAGGVARTSKDVGWLHGFLARLAVTGFAAPEPLPAFGGRSWAIGGGSLWQLLTFLPGEVVGWAAAPPMTEIGILMAHYHQAVSALGRTEQRPTALPLARVPAVLLSGLLETAGVGPAQAVSIRRLAAELAEELAEIQPGGTAQVVIHGDFTCHNVVAVGTPPAAAGVIDFELAHVESPLADIGYGLWRSGRPRQDADHLDAARVRQFMRGYTSVRPVSAEQARLIPVYLRGRGLQMIAKRIRAGRPETGMLAQVGWLSAHKDAVAGMFAADC